MPLTSPLSAYDRRWPAMFAQEAEGLRPMFGDALIKLHHVGSTAVAGLIAKPEIDILAIVNNVRDWTLELTARGYRRGGDLSEGHLFFKRDVNGLRTHKLHICVDGHPMALQMLMFRDHLRSNADDRRRYEALKSGLEAENTGGIAEYLKRKAPFIRSILDRIG